MKINDPVLSILHLDSKCDASLYHKCLDVFEKFGLCSIPVNERVSVLEYMNEHYLHDKKEHFDESKKYFTALVYTKDVYNMKLMSKIAYFHMKEDNPLEDTFFHIGNLCELYKTSLIVFDNESAKSEFARIISKVKPTIIIDGSMIREL